jgi:hypothetical protein
MLLNSYIEIALPLESVRAKKSLPAPVGRWTMIDERIARLRTHRNNIDRYLRLLQTTLTEIERRYLEGRLTEERSALESLIVSDRPSGRGWQAGSFTEDLAVPFSPNQIVFERISSNAQIQLANILARTSSF